MDGVTQALAGVVKNAAPTPQFMLSFFGKKVRKDTRYVQLQGKYSRARVAKFVNPAAVADGTESLDFQRTDIKLPTIQDVQSVTAEDLENIQIGDTEFTPKTPTEKLWVAIKEKVDDQKTMFANRNEKSAIEAIFDGKITVTGKGENRVIDFGRPAELTVDVGAVDATQYLDNAGDADKIITDGIQLLADYGKTANVLVGTPTTIGLIVNDSKIEKKLDNRRETLGQFTFVNEVALGVVYHGTYKGLAIFSYKGVDGAVPEKKLAFIASENGNETVYGYAPDITSEFGKLGVAFKSVRDKFNFISNLIPSRKSAEVEAIQTVAPLLGDVYSAAVFKVVS